MAQIVKLRRSSVSGQKPTNTNLQLGELALNTTDGKVYMAKSGSLGPSVEELISTNTVNTGSINLIGSITSSNVSSSFIGDGSQLYNIPLSGVTNLVTISGSFDDRLDSLEAYSGSQLVPSSSMSFRTLQTDVYCKNVSGAQINKGTVVRIVGSTGDNPLIGIANPTTEHDSANVLGIATVNIPNDSFGLVITEGVLTGVNTNGMTAGALLYLGAGGIFTTTPPTAPNHGVRLGEVLRVQQNQGSIYVRVDNGIELNEAHDVIYTGITHGDLLVRSGSVWKNSKSLEGNYVVTGSLTLTQNLTVLGSSSLVYVTSSNLAVSASFISVNVFEPAERFGGLKVYDSGSSNATASLAWDSQHNHWVYQNVDGASYSGGMLLSGPRNSGSLGDEPGLIDGRIVKSVGGDHIDVSIISETGTTINIDGNLVADSITGSFDFFGLVNRPTLVSGSSQIEITGTTGYSTFSSSVKDSIDIVTGSITDLSSSIATTTNDLDGRIDDLETESGSIRGDFNSFTSSYTTGSFTGSFIGDGSGLTNLSNITGSIGQVAILDSDKTVTSSWFTHVNNQTFGLGTDSYTLDQPERLMVDNYNSINIATFQTSQDDTYAQVNVKNFGSGSAASSDFVLWNDVTTEEDNYVDLGLNSSNYTDGFLGYENDGYLYSNANDLYVGSYSTGSHGHLHLFGGGNWDNSAISIYSDNTIGINTEVTGSVGSTIPSSIDGYAVEISGSVNFRNNIFLSGSVTSSYGVNTPIITNNGHTWEFGTDGKLTTPGDVNINGILTAKELHIDYVTSSVLYESGSTNFGNTSDDTHSFTGSVNITGSINVDSITGSIDFSNLTNVPTLVSGSSQIIDLGFVTTGSFESYTSSVDTSLNNVMLLTSSYVLNAETSSMTVLSSSYAVTASYALSVLGGDGSEGRTAKMEQSVASTTWTFNHYLGERFPAITVFNSDGFVIIPTNVEAIDTNQLEVTFSSAQSGYITATVGGGLPTISGSYDGRVLSIDGSSPVWKENIVSGSLQISNLGFSTTGSNSFNGNQTITGSLTIANTKMGSLCTTSTGDTIVLDLGDFDGATIDYIVKYNSNRRFGTIMGVWDGAQYEYNEVATMDIGNTSDISFNIDANGNVHAVSTLNTWEVTLSYRALGC